MKPSVSLLILLFSVTATILHPLNIAHAATCHPDDHQGLLGFKSGITHDPNRILASWKPTTHCCKWVGVTCSDGKRVDKLEPSRFLEEQERFLSGTISSSLSRLQYLTVIDLRDLQDLSGPFPAVLFRLPLLKEIFLDNNKFSGPLPRDIGNLTRVEILSLNGNRFTGPIPDSISGLTQVTNLFLGGNLLTGPIPEAIGSLSKMLVLNLTDNQLSGNIPNFFSSLPELRYVYLARNKLSGTLPASIEDLPTDVFYFEVGHNELTGEIPSFFGKFNRLVKLDLSWNHFSGAVPASIGTMPELGNLDLSHNNLVDPFPAFTNDRISQIDLSYNKFQFGKFPELIISAFSLNNVGLARCGIKASLEDWTTENLNKEFLITVDISENEISGSPVALFNATPFLREFRASGNKLKFNMGRLRIPKNLETLDVSRNMVFGNVPKAVARLESLDVSYNHLCGKLPATKFPESAFVGNDCLCGSPLPACKV